MQEHFENGCVTYIEDACLFKHVNQWHISCSALKMHGYEHDAVLQLMLMSTESVSEIPDIVDLVVKMQCNLADAGTYHEPVVFHKRKRFLTSSVNGDRIKCGKIHGGAGGKCCFEVGCSVVSRRNSAAGMIIGEKAGGWRVVRFMNDDSVGRYRPSDLWSACKSCDGMRRDSILWANPSSGQSGLRCTNDRVKSRVAALSGDMSAFHRGDNIIVHKSRKAGVIVDEKPGGWRVVSFDDGSSGTYRPSEFRLAPPSAAVAAAPEAPLTSVSKMATDPPAASALTDKERRPGSPSGDSVATTHASEDGVPLSSDVSIASTATVSVPGELCNSTVTVAAASAVLSPLGSDSTRSRTESELTDFDRIE